MSKDTVVIATGVFKPEPIVSASLMSDLAMELSRHYKVVVLRPKPTRPLGFKQTELDTSNLPYSVVQLESYTCPESSVLGRMRESVSFGNACERYIKEHNKEICFIYNAPWHLFGRRKVAKIALRYNIPYATPVQDIYPESVTLDIPVKIVREAVNALLLPIDKFALKNAAFVHTISTKMVDALAPTRNVERDKFVVVRNWQDESRFIEYREKNHEAKTDKNFTLLFLGNISPSNGLDVVIDAFHKASIEGSRLVIAGSGSYRDKLIEKVKEQSIPNVEFIQAPFDKVPEIQDMADVLLLPLKRGIGMTSIPSKLPAYLFSAKPVIASVDLEGDTAMCIKDCDCGWVVDPESVEELSRVMKIASKEDSEILKKKGRNGFEFAMKHLSRKANLKVLADACIEVIEKNK